MVQLLGTFAELEGETIKERVKLGQDRARAAGKRFGRPASIPAYVLNQLRKAHPNASTYQLWKFVQAEGFKVAYSTVTRSLKRHAA
jgi:DNA invertase Pin-like site-specific DNA recombinase